MASNGLVRTYVSRIFNQTFVSREIVLVQQFQRESLYQVSWLLLMCHNLYVAWAIMMMMPHREKV